MFRCAGNNSICAVQYEGVQVLENPILLYQSVNQERMRTTALGYKDKNKNNIYFLSYSVDSYFK
jgi:hypothetical protein